MTTTDVTGLDRVVDLLGDLIRFDTSNYGGGESRGEREAAEWVAARLTDAGLEPVVLESAPRRASTVVRIPGRDRSAPGLMVHGHLDVVPAQASDWSVDPFAGEIRDDCLWGRGTLDMKDTVAGMLAVATTWADEGFVPPRDVVLAFVADEEDTGDLGAGFLAREHRDLFEGVTTAIGESGGGLIRLPDGGHLYGIGAGERGTAWMTLTARGPAGHGSKRQPDNAVATIARTVAALDAIAWPVRVIPAVQAFLDGVGERLGVRVDPTNPASLAALGRAADLVDRTLANSLSPTMLRAGYKANVIPTEATATVDGRILPGLEDEFFAAVDAVLPPTVTRAFASRTYPVAADPASPEFAAMTASLLRADPGATVVPSLLGGGTDAKAFSSIGIACYGFTPQRFPESFGDGEPLVHGVDERVPLESLHWGVRVFDDYLRSDPYHSATVPEESA